MPGLGLLCCGPGLLPKPTSSQDLETRSPSQLSQDPAEGWPRGRSDNASKITPVEGRVPSTLPACLPETGPVHGEASVDWMVCVEVVLPASGPSPCTGPFPAEAFATYCPFRLFLMSQMPLVPCLENFASYPCVLRFSIVTGAAFPARTPRLLRASQATFVRHSTCAGGFPIVAAVG